MVLQVLDDLHSEISRLYMAGSKFAVDDPLIKKISRQLGELGAKSPVMKKLSELCDALTSSAALETPDKLSNLFVLLTAILRTQCSTELSAEFVKADESGQYEPEKTLFKRSELIDIITEFSGKDRTGSDKLKEILDTDIKYDFRLFPYYSLALGHKTHEVAIKAVGAAGTRILPYIMRDFNINGGSGDARRFAVLHMLGHAAVRDIAQKIIDEGAAAELTVCAVEILGKDIANEKLILALADDKKHDVREAAFSALANMNSTEGKQKIISILGTKKYACAVTSSGLINETHFNLSVLSIIKEYYNAAISDIKKSSDFMAVLPALIGKSNPEIFAFYKEMTENAQKLGFSKSTNWTNTGLYRTMLKNVSAADAKLAADFFEWFSKSALSASPAGWQADYLNVMLSSPKDFSKEYAYEKFSKEYKNGKFQIYNVDADVLLLDERWYDLFYDKNELSYVTKLLDKYSLLSAKAQKKLKSVSLTLVSDLSSDTLYYYCYIIRRLIPLCSDKEKRAVADDLLRALSTVKPRYTFYYLDKNFREIYRLLYAEKEILDIVKKKLSKTDPAKDAFMHTILTEIITEAN